MNESSVSLLAPMICDLWVLVVGTVKRLCQYVWDRAGSRILFRPSLRRVPSPQVRGDSLG